MFGETNIKENQAVSLGFPCSSDLQCQLADRESRCVEGVCDCVVKKNGTEFCGRENTGCSPATFQVRLLI